MPKKTPEQEPSIEEILSSIRQIISDDDQEVAESESGAEAPADGVDADVAEIAAATAGDASDASGETMGSDDIDAMFAEEPAQPAEPEETASAEGGEEDVLDLTEDMQVKEEEEQKQADTGAVADGDVADDSEASDSESSAAGDEEDKEPDLNISFDDIKEEDTPEAKEAEVEEEEASDTAELEKVEEPEQETVAEVETPPPPAVDAGDDMGDELMSEATKAAAVASMAKISGKMRISSPPAGEDIPSVTLEDIVKDLLNPMLKEWFDENLPPMVEEIVQKEIKKLADESSS